MRQNIFCLIGRGGSGKDTILKLLLKLNNNLTNNIEITTRDKREYEINGKDKIFLSHDEFMNKVKSNEIVVYYEQPMIQKNKNEIRLYGYSIPDNQNIIMTHGINIYEKLFYLPNRKFNLIPIYINSSDKNILTRLILREHKDGTNNFEEAIRRYFYDKKIYNFNTFSEEFIPSENYFLNNKDPESIANDINNFINNKIKENEKCQNV